MLVLNTLIQGKHEFYKKAPQSGEENNQSSTPAPNPNENQNQNPENPVLDPEEGGGK